MGLKLEDLATTRSAGCRYCGADNTVRHGYTSKRKQRHRCRTCGRSFVWDRGFELSAPVLASDASDVRGLVKDLVGVVGALMETIRKNSDPLARELGDGISPENVEEKFPPGTELAVRLLLRLARESAERPPSPELRGRPLTSRELEVLKLVALGMPNIEIARRLAASACTVKRHVENTLDKLGSSTRTQAVVRALELGLISLPTR